MHHDRVDAMVKALELRRLRRRDGEDAPHFALEVGR